MGTNETRLDTVKRVLRDLQTMTRIKRPIPLISKPSTDLPASPPRNLHANDDPHLHVLRLPYKSVKLLKALQNTNLPPHLFPHSVGSPSETLRRLTQRIYIVTRVSSPLQAEEALVGEAAGSILCSNIPTKDTVAFGSWPVDMMD